MTPLRICVVGAGAVGGFLAARMADAGLAMSVLARGATLAAIRADGLILESANGNTVAKVPASEDAADLGPQDCVILATKQQSIPGLAGALAPLLGPGTIVVPAINGVPWWFFHRFGGPLDGTRLESVDPQGRTWVALPPERVVGCVVHIAASTPAPGRIRHGGGERFILGEPSRASSPRLDRVISAFARAGLEPQASDFIQRDIWEKLWGNATYNAISALTRATADRIGGDPRVRRLAIGMMGEIADVGRRIGIESRMTPDERIAIADRLGAFKTSMLQDLENGRTLEIDGLNGALAEIAGRLGVQTPLLDTVHALIRLKAEVAGLYPRTGDAS